MWPRPPGNPEHFVPFSASVVIQAPVRLVGEDGQPEPVEAAGPDLQRRARRHPQGHREGGGHGAGGDGEGGVSRLWRAAGAGLPGRRERGWGRVGPSASFICSFCHAQITVYAIRT